MSDDIDPDRKFSNGTDWDNSIDCDDASDGSDGGYDRHGSPINANAMKELVQLRMETSRLRAENEKLREALIDTTASLVASVSLLERGGKKAAPSDKMFAQMLVDYKNSIDRARAALEGVTEKEGA